MWCEPLLKFPMSLLIFECCSEQDGDGGADIARNGIMHADSANPWLGNLSEFVCKLTVVIKSCTRQLHIPPE